MFSSTLKQSISWAAAAAVATGAIVSVPASASVTVPVDQQQLSFNKGKSSEDLTTTITQRQGVDDNDEDLGNDAKLNDYILYYDVLAGVDAILTVTGIQGMETDGSDRQIIEEIDESNDGNIASASGDNKWINTDMDSNINGESYVEYTLEFFQDVDAFTRIPVTLTDVVMNTYDIDGSSSDAERQYLEISDFSRYYLTSDTELSVTDVGTRTRFTSLQQPSNPTDPENRVKVEFDRVSKIVFRLGQLTTQSGVSGASFYLDFSSGPTWSPAPAVVSPVLAAAQPRDVNYEGPINLRHQAGTLCSNGEAVLTGQRLNTITEIYVGDKKVAQELLPDGRLKYSLKDITPGTYQIRYWVPVNNVNLTDQIRVGTCSTAPIATTPGAFEASRLFANYRGDRGPVIARDRAAITAFINQYKGITNVRCVGSTSGVPAKSTDPALAQARAKNACDVVKRLVPNATISLETSTGKGIGQRFRSVTIFISGTN